MRFSAETKRLAKQMDIPIICANRMAVLNHQIAELIDKLDVKAIGDLQRLLCMYWNDFADDRNISKLLVHLEVNINRMQKRLDSDIANTKH
jgi:hypothetical protein